MYRDILEHIGLNKNEAILYETLLFSGEMGLSALAVKAGIHRRNAYDSLQSLIQRGLVFEVVEAQRNQYQAVEPAKLQELVQEKSEVLQKIMPALEKAYARKETAERVYLYRGIEGFKNNLRDVLRIDQPLYEIGAKGGWFSPHVQSFMTSFLREYKRKKLPHQCLLDAEAKSLSTAELSALGAHYRFLPKEYSTNSVIHIFGNHVVTFTGVGHKTLREDLTLFVMISDALAESYRTWFRLLWSRSA